MTAFPQSLEGRHFCADLPQSRSFPAASAVVIKPGQRGRRYRKGRTMDVTGHAGLQKDSAMTPANE
ncbi:hypothetical protein [Maioricimonas sp. JC845]|uniref:hypothetical protein n=1 Tax=Maioricimonas sp. JC845 TaxID=3232138 RepID=UPI00345774A7